MKQLVIEMAASVAIVLPIYYGLVFVGMTEPRWTAGLAVLLTGVIVAVGKRALQHKHRA
jgi:hypothetical protein